MLVCEAVMAVVIAASFAVVASQWVYMPQYYTKRFFSSSIDSTAYYFIF
jgi:hypothetical protein